MGDNISVGGRHLDWYKWLFGKDNLSAEDVALVQYLREELEFHDNDAIWGVVKAFANGRQDFERVVSEMRKSVSDIRPALTDALLVYKEKGGAINLIQASGDKVLSVISLMNVFSVMLIICAVCFFVGIMVSGGSPHWLAEIRASSYLAYIMQIPAGWIFFLLSGIPSGYALFRIGREIWFADKAARRERAIQYLPFFCIAFLMVILSLNIVAQIVI